MSENVFINELEVYRCYKYLFLSLSLISYELDCKHGAASSSRVLVFHKPHNIFKSGTSQSLFIKMVNLKYLE